MIIENKSSGIIGVPYRQTAKGPIIGRVDLLPGCNDVKKEIWDFARNECKGHIDRNVIVERFAKVVDGKLAEAKEFLELEPRDADAVVSETYSPNTLTKWKTEESRDAVRANLGNQIEKVKSHGSKKTGE
jgi:hypothetical protein